jgi:hypothetical protein
VDGDEGRKPGDLMSTSNVVAQSAACSLDGQQRISDGTLAAVRAIPLVDVAGAVIALRPTGRRLIGLCPFHSEKTPSFGIDPEKNLWYCHGCNKGGDVVRFVELLERCSFRHAIEILAARAGLFVENAVLDHAKLAAEAQRRASEKQNREVLHRQQIKAARRLDHLRAIERSCSLETLPANLFSRLRRADVYYTLVNFLAEADAIQFLRLSRADQLQRIDQAIDDGYVRGDRAVWEVPLQ